MVGPRTIALSTAAAAALMSACASSGAMTLPVIAAGHASPAVGATVWVTTAGLEYGLADVPLSRSPDSARARCPGHEQPVTGTPEASASCVDRLRSLRAAHNTIATARFGVIHDHAAIRADERVVTGAVRRAAQMLRAAGFKQLQVIAVSARGQETALRLMRVEQAVDTALERRDLTLQWGQTASAGLEVLSVRRARSARGLYIDRGKARVYAGPEGACPAARRDDAGVLRLDAVAKAATQVCREQRGRNAVGIALTAEHPWGEVLRVAAAAATSRGCRSSLAFDAPPAQSIGCPGAKRISTVRAESIRGAAPRLIGDDTAGARRQTRTSRRVARLGQAMRPGLGRAQVSLMLLKRSAGTCHVKQATRIVRWRLWRIKQCYRRVLALRPGVKGSVALTFDSDVRGYINNLTVTPGSRLHPDAARCVDSAFAGARLPAPTDGKPCQFQVEFEFKP